jgi:hypothetical protein
MVIHTIAGFGGRGATDTADIVSVMPAPSLKRTYGTAAKATQSLIEHFISYEFM